SRSRRPTAATGSTSTTSSASSNPGARAITSPSSSSTTEWPSKISSSCPPTALQSATKHELSRARTRSISSRSRSLPTWHGDAAGARGDRGHRLARGADEGGAQQQVLRRVAGDRQLGKEHQVGTGGARLEQGVRDPLRVPVEVADHGVHLRERESHSMPLSAV